MYVRNNSPGSWAVRGWDSPSTAALQLQKASQQQMMCSLPQSLCFAPWSVVSLNAWVDSALFFFFFFLSFVPPRGFSQHLRTPKPGGLGTKFAPSKTSNFNGCVCCKAAPLRLKRCPSFHELCASLQSSSVSETPLTIPSDENKSRCRFTALVRTIRPPSQLLPPVTPVHTADVISSEGCKTTACDIQQLRKSLN